ncbi:3-keto-disaccharide hydrolase [Allorhodopirellula solitaria]|uniref:3-keto-alpha-glucoside-1,2-lyase/3-keto-2-hydroxy-glucal hydratase domain-containing protein n=1 Tax=Allorhodopirellula solitaria TaxID=2527987 RepID=A0A5C5X297_9BACT|nr:DUF1080 domain-containing protein [Allorhodopirellula solitaria]TWT56285.1 hypothetical protein CA85_42860 [Allorhodopirellula solitaria]
MNITIPASSLARLSAAALLLLLVGCSRQADPEPPASDQAIASEDAPEQAAAPQADDAAFTFEAEVYEASAEELLAARLPIEETTEGWIRLFDGHTMFGWMITGQANWRVEDGTLTADRGEACLLSTSTRWADFELEVEFQADAETNSGVFLRSVIDPKDAQTDCFEINIAPADNPFPTGSIVGREKCDVFAGDASQWHTMNLVCNGESLTVKIDDQVTCESDDAGSPRNGHIGLQFREGAIRFRNVRLRPLNLESLVDANLSKWKQYEEMPGDFTVNDDQAIVVDGGKQQLESTESYGDFTLLTDYKMDDPESNSGIFFRAIPGDEMMGYECQVNNAMVDGNPLQPADCGPGGIFRRQDARIVAGEPGRWNSILLAADGPHFATWVNGVQVTDVTDDRPADENPRRGTRVEPGTLILQGHDETTQATYRKIEIQPAP